MWKKLPTNTCMQNGKCKYHYPRPYKKKSIQAKDGYPIYKRRDGRIESDHGINMTNQWLVPYSPYLLPKYNFHMNVDVSKVKAIKYL